MSSNKGASIWRKQQSASGTWHNVIFAHVYGRTEEEMLANAKFTCDQLNDVVPGIMISEDLARRIPELMKDSNVHL